MDAETAQGLVRDLLGPVLIGTFWNCGFLAAELIALGFYLVRFPHDTIWIRCLLAAAVTNDVLASVLNCWITYRYAVTGFGDVMGLTEQGVAFVLYAISLAFAAAFTQGYLIQRFHLICKLWYCTAILAAAAGLLFGITLYVSFALNKFTTVADRDNLTLYINVMFSTEVVTDLMIAISLFAALAHHYRGTEIASTRSLLRRLMIYSLESGAAPSILAIATLASFHANKSTNLPVGIAFNLGRIYTITLLLNLLMRQGLADRNDAAQATSGQNVSSHSFKMTKLGGRRHSNSLNGGLNSGIHTIRTTQVILEDRESEKYRDCKDPSKV